MKSALVKPRATKPDLSGLSRVLPQARALIEMSRQQVVTTANLTLVCLYWNVGRVISAEIQRHAKRAEYGEGWHVFGLTSPPQPLPIPAG